MNRHIARAALLAAATVVVGAITGCQEKSPAQNVRSASAQPPLVETKPTTAPTDTQAGTADALKSKMENYAREVGPLLSNKKSRKDPSDVDFINPNDLTLGPVGQSARPEPPVQVIPIENPVVDSTPSLPNQGAELVSAVKPAAPVPGSGANVNRVVADLATTPDRAITAPPLKNSGPNAGELDLLINKNLKDYPRDIWAHLDYQLLQFLKDKPTPQLDVLSRLPTEDRELVTAFMDAVTNLRNGLRADGNMLVSRKIRPLLDLADRLRAQADLLIPALSICTKVDGFGVYEPIEPASFTAMKEHPVIVYCEVQNFASQLNARKLWETKLSQEVVLYTESGLPVWQDKTENIPDLARNRRHDFFVVKKTKFPPNIAIGRYLLKVTIVDQQASRVAEATIPVQFVAQ